MALWYFADTVNAGLDVGPELPGIFGIGKHTANADNRQRCHCRICRLLIGFQQRNSLICSTGNGASIAASTL